MKKKILALAAVALCASITVSGTIAYYTAAETAHNVITTGGVGISIEEWQLENEELVPYPDKPIDIMPGCAVSKIVTVKNENDEAFIRAKYEIVITDADGNEMELDENTLTAIMTIVPDSTHWTQRTEPDGWWYYSAPVATDKATEPLFEEVIFSGPNMTNEYQNCTVEVIVDAQAVQTANNGSSVLEAQGWPVE